MQIINTQLLDETSNKAKQSPRKRINHNFHERLDDPVNRFLNAMEPDTYVRPHRHLHPEKEEIFILLRGKLAFFTFDDAGNTTDKLILNPDEGVYGVEAKAGVWHSVVVLEPDTVIYEIKQGPFTPLTPEDLAPWSPDAEQKDDVKKYITKLKASLLEPL